MTDDFEARKQRILTDVMAAVPGMIRQALSGQVDYPPVRVEYDPDVDEYVIIARSGEILGRSRSSAKAARLFVKLASEASAES